MKNDQYLRCSPSLPAIIKLNLNHDHTVGTADALRYQRVKEEVQEQFNTYFNDGLTPSAAIKLHEEKVLAEGNYQSLADASINPTKRSVYYFHDKWRQRTLGSEVSPLAVLKSKTQLYSEKGYFPISNLLGLYFLERSSNYIYELL